ncbi:hypothetical protein [Duganella violaceipulchra]|uniref:Uncharacterized protein n=1 Tax=Duganella violaceipulchra TaxID=2849652 RepID=A0AA41L862_9BURK|nr:hypothetical protein [Duganella violaceicalia]MBV6321910.1 hypothetical protein [Duganella violaceicalia]MCP2007096.1 hypothetical protein [Duganella violaceicalia]
MKMTVDELIAKLQEISAAGAGQLPVEVHKNEAYGSFDVEVSVQPPRIGVHGPIPARVCIDPAD